MPSFPDSAVLILLVLLLFGPKKLPELARQFGKLMNDFRRASNEFRSQMEDELRLSEQAEQQKQIAALASAGTPTLDPAQPDLAGSPYADQNFVERNSELDYASQYPPDSTDGSAQESTYDSLPESAHETTPDSTTEPEPVAAPLPIAISGEPSILPPSTGLPVATSAQLPFPEDLPAVSPAPRPAFRPTNPRPTNRGSAWLRPPPSTAPAPPYPTAQNCPA